MKTSSTEIFKVHEIRFSNLPFTPKAGEVIYVEEEYDKKINRFIRWHKAYIRKVCNKLWMTFAYMPDLAAIFGKKKILRYLSPGSNIKSSSNLNSTLMKKYLVPQDDGTALTTGLIFFKRVENGMNVFWHVSLTDCEEINKDSFSQAIRALYREREQYRRLEEEKQWKTRNRDDGMHYSIKKRKDIPAEFSTGSGAGQHSDHIRYSIAEDDGIRFREVEFQDDTYYFDKANDAAIKKKLGKAKELINELRALGVGEMVIRELIEIDEKPSPMLITKDKRILLTDYNIEVKMAYLEKVAYFLYLRHPEGINYKYLPDYRDEVEEIYGWLKYDVKNRRAQDTIDRLLDPFSNSMSEQTSRVRAAFLSVVQHHIAKNYIIQGKVGEAKSIPLPRHLVTWE